MRYSYIKELQEVSKSDFLLVGGKGANLGEMLKANLPVPGGFVLLTNAYQKFIDHNHLEENIQSLLNNVDKNDIDGMEKASKKIKDLFEKGEIPNEVLEEIHRIYRFQGNREVAIRSSSTAEDLPGISFAGQYSTYLNVQGDEEVYKYIKKCWASLWNARAVSYRKEQKIDNRDLGHGVIVQNLINSEKSGILFTANPVNGRRDQILINSSWGLGEAIVGGEVTPDQWAVDKNTRSIVEEKIAKKETMTIRKEKGILFIPVPKSKQREITLNKKEIENLLDLALKVERYFGSPQDIEWAFSEGKFYLVQSRPITSLYPIPKVIQGKGGFRIYINVNNYSQAMKEPFTPMGVDIVKSIFGGVVDRFIKKNSKADSLWWAQVIGGRLFFDITDFMRTERSWDKFKKEDPADKDPMTTKALLQLVQRNREEIIDPKKAVNMKKMINYNLIKILISTAAKISYGARSPINARNKALSLGQKEIEAIKEQRKQLKTIENKLSYLERNGGESFVTGFGIVFYVWASSSYIQKARKIMEQYLEDTTDLDYVQKSVPYSATTEMGMEILSLAKSFDKRGKKPTAEDTEIKKFLEKYGHRNSIELDVGIPVWKEDPQYVLDLISTYIDNKNYQQAIDKFYLGKKEAEKAIQRIKRKLEEKGQKAKAKKVEKLLRDFREMFGIREQSKFFIRQVLTVFREVLIEIGEELKNKGLLEDKIDVFYVTIADIRSNKNLKQLVIENKENYNRDLKRVAPRLLTNTGECIYSPVEEGKEGSRVGIPVSPGVYQGKIRILHNPEEGHKLEKGEILVTTGTNPSWTPLFLKLGALIMETGGPISHGSVVAREYGLPAVAGVINATTILKDGQVVKVNGETGIVELVSAQSAQE